MIYNALFASKFDLADNGYEELVTTIIWASDSTFWTEATWSLLGSTWNSRRL